MRDYKQNLKWTIILVCIYGSNLWRTCLIWGKRGENFVRWLSYSKLCLSPTLPANRTGVYCNNKDEFHYMCSYLTTTLTDYSDNDNVHQSLLSQTDTHWSMCLTHWLIPLQFYIKITLIICFFYCWVVYTNYLEKY